MMKVAVILISNQNLLEQPIFQLNDFFPSITNDDRERKNRL